MATVQQRLQADYHLVVPDEFVWLCDLAKKLSPSRPLAAFEVAGGIRLAGPFRDVLEPQERRRRGCCSSTGGRCRIRSLRISAKVSGWLVSGEVGGLVSRREEEE